MKLMTALKSKKGMSNIELFCIVGICILLIIIAAIWINSYRAGVQQGKDDLILHTAESTARVTFTSEQLYYGGEAAGYFDPLTNKITREKPAGYNNYKVMTAGDETFKGERGTMVIMAEMKNGELVFSWVEGDNK